MEGGSAKLVFLSNEISRDEAEANIRVYEFLNNCSEKDLNILLDSGAFNNIAEKHLHVAVSELVNEKIINDEQGREVQSRFLINPLRYSFVMV